MSLLLKRLIAVCISSVVTGTISINAAPPGFLEGHLGIVSSKEVDLAEATPTKGTIENYADYPLLILSKEGGKEVARVTAGADGNYRVELPPGDYVLDIQRRPRGRLRAKPQPFNLTSGQTVHVDMDLDMGVR